MTQRLNQVTARACANIALCKYWGKHGPGNAPATPSISLALAELVATTTVSRISGSRDQLLLNGQRPAGTTRERLLEYLDLWRRRGLISGCFRIESRNSFPTAAGLASSAAGYAALALALSAFSRSHLAPAEISRLARWGSGSSARSIPGGLAALATGEDPAARRLADAADVPWGMVVALVNARKKQVSSREGMELSRRTSKFFEEWTRVGRQHYREMRRALRSWDLAHAGELMEANTLAMHACMLTTRPPLLYWRPATLELLQQARDWRRAGLPVYATTDAGANVALLCQRSDLARVAQRIKRLKSAGTAIADMITSQPGGPARIVARS
jgi:diphosphomevalonate decarboxylase